MAIEAAEEAERMLRDENQDRRRTAELELQQAQYDASLAERRHAACDPDNRLIAAQLEKAWETALGPTQQSTLGAMDLANNVKHPGPLENDRAVSAQRD
jgi:hypothetical protein